MEDTWVIAKNAQSHVRFNKSSLSPFPKFLTFSLTAPPKFASRGFCNTTSAERHRARSIRSSVSPVIEHPAVQSDAGIGWRSRCERPRVADRGMSRDFAPRSSKTACRDACSTSNPGAGGSPGGHMFLRIAV